METNRDSTEKPTQHAQDTPSVQVPAMCRIVKYRVTEEQAEQINRRRTTPASIRERIVACIWPTGAQAHIGNDVYVGAEFPMLIIRAFGLQSRSPVNGQVFLDGNDVLWVNSVSLGEGPGTFSWPTR